MIVICQGSVLEKSQVILHFRFHIIHFQAERVGACLPEKG
jgi:hypothetical protein